MRLFCNIGFIFILFFLFACKKSTVDEIVKIPETPVVKDTTTKAPPPVVAVGKTVDVGTGSGNLIIDGTSLPLKCNDRIRIAKGSYKSITIKNIQAADGCAITVTNNGLVDINGNFSQMNLSNLKGVIISGNGDPNIQYGFQFHDNSYRSILITKPYTSSTIQHMSFKNIQDYVISYDPKTVYDGSEGSYSKDLKFLNIFCENTSSFLQFPGSIENGPIVGLIKGLEIANLTFINSSKVGTMIWIGDVEDYDVHNNRVDNINSENNNHNGIFHLMGNGKFHDNYVSNHQGNAIRAWTYSIGSPKEVLIYNNIVVNSRKYSAFEVQSFDNYMKGSVTYANAKVYNNTCGNLNLNKDWYGNVVDVYNLEGGTCQVFNNIGFNFPAPNPVTLISNQQSVTKPQESNNLYFTTIDEVGFSDKTTFKLNPTSTAKNKGIAVLTLLKDYYGTARNTSKPSIGAVE